MIDTTLSLDLPTTVLDHAGMTPRARALLVAGVWVRCVACAFAGAPKGWGRRRARGYLPAGRLCPGCKPVKSLAARLKRLPR